MAENLVTITKEEYATLVKAESTLDLVYKIVKADESMFGYTDRTAKMLDTVLEIERAEK